ncbi:MAG: molybdopterin-guanine dinucleotide biosynthesis protein B [Candidatus Bathyarchaeia archaeon]
MKTKTIAVIGTKKSGKTTTITNLIQELTKRGYKVAAIKHINEPNFTIDTPNKDTWKYAQAGAKTIIAIAQNETTTIQKTPIQNQTLTTLLKKCAENDIIIIEGLKQHTATNKNIPKIIVTKTPEEAADALKKYKPILAFTGPSPTTTITKKIPYIDTTKNSQQLATLVINKLKLKK